MKWWAFTFGVGATLNALVAAAMIATGKAGQAAVSVALVAVMLMCVSKIKTN